MEIENSHKTLLLVEDQALVAMTEEAMLEKYGYDVITVDDVQGAIEAIENTPVDLILMYIDLGKGRMTGTEAAEILLKKFELPIVFLTGHGEKETVAAVQRITNYGYVLKSAGEFVLIESINMALKLWESHRQAQSARDEYLSIVELTEEIIARVDSDGRWMFVNSPAERFWGIPKKELLGKRYIDFVHPEDKKETLAAGDVMYTTRKPILDLVNRQRTPDGWRTISWNSSPIFNERGEVEGFQSTGRDITEQKEAENRLKLISDIITDHAYVVAVDAQGSLKLEWSTANYEEGIKNISRKGIQDFVNNPSVHPDDAPIFEKRVKNLSSNREDISEYRIITDDGEIIWVRDYGKPIWDDNEERVTAIVGALQIITELKNTEKRLKESEKHFRELVEYSNDWIWQVNTEGEYTYVSPTVEKITGYTPEEIVGKTPFNFMREDEAERTRKAFAENLHTGEPFSGTETELIHKAGCTVILETNGTPYFDEQGNLLGYRGIDRDITARKKMEKDLLKALKEKDYLMKELNHRVKNNLLLISSLINLKASSLDDKVDMSDVAGQIDAIRIIHDKLMHAEDIAHIDLEGYIQELLATVFSLSGRQVEIEENIEKITLQTRTAIPVGLILNEIATNAIKHGFSDTGKARFTVELKADKRAEQYVLTLSNTGKAFPGGIDLKNPDTLGLRLISGLVGQLKGTIELQRDPCPVFTIRFPIDEE